MKNFREDSFHEEISKGVSLVDFYADWCGPCRMMAPVLEELSQEMSGKAHFGKVDVDKNQRLASTYSVTSIPTLVLFKNGKEVGRVVGIRDADSLREFVESAL